MNTKKRGDKEEVKENKEVKGEERRRKRKIIKGKIRKVKMRKGRKNIGTYQHTYIEKKKKNPEEKVRKAHLMNLNIPCKILL